MLSPAHGERRCAFENVDEDEISKHNQGETPSLCQRHQNTDDAGRERAERWDEFEQEGEQTQQHGVGDVEQIHAAGDEAPDEGGERELAADVSAQHPLPCGEQDGETSALCDGCVPAQPVDEVRSLNEKIETKDQHEYDV